MQNRPGQQNALSGVFAVTCDDAEANPSVMMRRVFLSGATLYLHSLKYVK